MTKEMQGLSLLDIGAPSITVPVGETTIEVYGLSVENIIQLLQRFPDAGAWLSPGAVEISKMVTTTPKLIEAIIAVATGTPENESEKAEKIAARLSVETQLDILEAVVKLTFKDGFGPFVQRIAALSDVAASVNFGRVMATNLQPPSKPSSPPDTAAQA